MHSHKLSLEPISLNPISNITPQWPSTILGHHSAFLCAIVLAPLRILLIVLTVLWMFIFSSIATLGHTRGTPLSSIRRLLVQIFVRPGFRVILFAVGFIFINEIGKPSTKKDANILIANHVSGPWEAMYIIWRASSLIVAEQSNVSSFFMRPIFSALDGIGVDRTNPGNTREKIESYAKDKRRPQVLLFPEGTCSNGTALLGFKTGAFSPLLPIQAAAISFPTRKDLDISWVSVGPGIIVLLSRLLRSWYTPMTVTWLSPFEPPSIKSSDAPLIYMRTVRQSLASALGVKATQLNIDDVQMGIIAQRAHFKPELAIVELATVRQHVNINFDEAKALLRVFFTANPSTDGKINFLQFVKLISELRNNNSTNIIDKVTEGTGAGAIPTASSTTPLLEQAAALSLDADKFVGDGPHARAAIDMYRLFDAFDVGRDGLLDVREFLVGLALLSDRAPEKDISAAEREHSAHMKLAFELLCDEGETFVTHERFSKVLHHVWPDLAESRVAEIFSIATGGKSMITRDAFMAWVTRPDVIEQLPLFRQRFLGEDLITKAVKAQKR
jgi:lysophosphatidylcholine acyltransferase / lyso-PAF acetyltransferase